MIFLAQAAPISIHYHHSWLLWMLYITGALLTIATLEYLTPKFNSAPAFSGNAGTVPAEVFSGSSLDNRSAFVKVIFCVKL